MKTKSLTPFQLIVYAALIAAVLVFCAGLTACTKTEVIEKTIVKDSPMPVIQDKFMWERKIPGVNPYWGFKYESSLSEPTQGFYVYTRFTATPDTIPQLMKWRDVMGIHSNYVHLRTFVSPNPPRDGEIPQE